MPMSSWVWPTADTWQGCAEHSEYDGLDRHKNVDILCLSFWNIHSSSNIFFLMPKTFYSLISLSLSPSLAHARTHTHTQSKNICLFWRRLTRGWAAWVDFSLLNVIRQRKLQLLQSERYWSSSCTFYTDICNDQKGTVQLHISIRDISTELSLSLRAI